LTEDFWEGLGMNPKEMIKGWTKWIAAFVAVAVSATSFAFDWGLPPQATDVAGDLDMLYIGITLMSIFFFVLVMGLIGLFVVKYRHREGHKATYIEGNIPLEVFWTAIPTVLVIGLFVWGWMVYKDMTYSPADALEIRVVGKQWAWKFQYDDGRTTDNEVFVPVNRPVRLVMSSQDVLHGFFVPDFRVKKDVVPGMYSYLSFEATVPGEHQVFCTEYCGGSHSGMLAKLYALTESQWKLFERGKTWEQIQALTSSGQLNEALAKLEEEGDSLVVSQQAAPRRLAGLAAKGKHLSESKGCISCHSVSGPQGIGPSYKGLFGAKRTLSDGSEVVADENYLRESIEVPHAKIVKGFSPMMPTYLGQLGEEDINALIAYIKSLKEVRQ
jgi:cytochrome c oxidase subunit 2